MIVSIPSTEKFDYRTLIEKLVCSDQSKLSMLHRCPQRSGRDGSQSCVESKLGDRDDWQAQFKQSKTTDMTTLVDHLLDLPEFIDI